MDRFAVFVDAGYLLAGAGHLMFGLPRRQIICDYGSIVEALCTWCTQHGTESDPLRLYWYDGAPNLQPLEDHNKIAALPNVKTRLGRLTSKGQKGVDSRIVRDVIVLAHQRAMTTGYLLSGDEDLREGVSEAQDSGVRIVLLGLPQTEKSRQSFALCAEADEHVVLPPEFWQPHFRRAPAETAVTRVRSPDLPGRGQQSPKSTAVEATAMSSDIDEREVRAAARQFSESWLLDAAPRLVTEVREGRPQIPRDLDTQLMRAVEDALRQTLRGVEAARRAARSEFWRAVRLRSAEDAAEGVKDCTPFE